MIKKINLFLIFLVLIGIGFSATCDSSYLNDGKYIQSEGKNYFCKGDTLFSAYDKFFSNYDYARNNVNEEETNKITNILDLLSSTTTTTIQTEFSVKQEILGLDKTLFTGTIKDNQISIINEATKNLKNIQINDLNDPVAPVIETTDKNVAKTAKEAAAAKTAKEAAAAKTAKEAAAAKRYDPITGIEITKNNQEETTSIIENTKLSEEEINKYLKIYAENENKISIKTLNKGKNENAKVAYKLYLESKGENINELDTKILQTFKDDPFNEGLSKENRNILAKFTELSETGEKNVVKEIEPLMTNIATKKKELKDQDLSDSDRKTKKEELEELEKKLTEILDFAEGNVNMNSVLNSMTPEQQEEFADQYAERNCGNGFSGWVCKAFTTSSAQEQSKIAYMKDVQNIQKEWEEDSTYTNDKKELDTYESQIGIDKVNLETCKKDKKKCDKQEKLLKTNEKNLKEAKNKIKEDYYTYYNKQLATKLLNNVADSIKDKVKNSCETLTPECKTAIGNIECTTNECKTNKKNALAQFDAGSQNQFIETGLVYEVFSFLKDDFESGKKVARAFHIQPKYENVPEWLNDTFASKICMAKIGGYLTDKLIGNDAIKDGYNPSNFNTGGTRYGSCVQDDKNPNTQQSSLDCTEVKADIRATRSPITPDNKIWISYSAVMKTPESGSVLTGIIVLYKQGNKIQKQFLGNSINVTKAEFGKYWIPENTYEELNINTTYGKVNYKSMQIYLISAYQNKVKYMKLSNTIEPAISDKYDGINFGNSEGNSAAKENKETKLVSDEDLFDMLD